MSKFTTINARDLKFVGEQFGSSQGAVARLWRGSKTQRTGVLHKEDAETKRHNCQPPKKWDPEAVQDALKELPWNQRKNVRSAALKLGIPHSTLQYMKKTLVIQRKRSSLKPHLSKENKMWRVAHALSKRSNDLTHYDSIYSDVHVDEKWFQQTEDGVIYLCVPDEEPPHRTCQRKRHIGKITFLCPMARP